jgi:hypothetical protein
MRHSLAVRSQPSFLGTLVLAGLGALILCLPAAGGRPSSAVAARGPALQRVRSTPASSQPNATDATTLAAKATDATTLAANATGGAPAGGVLGDVTGLGDTAGLGLGDILAIDQSGNLWLYPNTGSGDASMFSGGRSQVGQGWTGYTLAAVGPLDGTDLLAGIVAIDPAGNLWYYPNTGGTGLGTFGTPTQIGVGWTGYTIVGITDLYSFGEEGLLAIDPAGNLWYYQGSGVLGASNFPYGRIQVGSGWTGYTADVADINGSGYPDIVAVDPSGNLWLYPNTAATGGTGTSTFAAPVQVGSGWSGFQAVDLGFLSNSSNTASEADILAIGPGGNLWYYPDTGASGFGAPIQVGTGWTGYRIN